MALPDLTGLNIQDTYKRVVHTDGTNYYNGTGSLLNIGGGGSTFPYTGSAVITGSLLVSSSLTVTGSLNVSQGITGSLFGTSSRATSASWAPMRPGGANTQIQYNFNGTLAGTPEFAFNNTNSSLTQGNNNKAVGNFSHAEGDGTLASGYASHAEGVYTSASGDYSHAEGASTLSVGKYSHAEGRLTSASGDFSHAEGYGTIASGSYQHVQGQYNLTSSVQSAFIHGNGTSNAARSNLIFAAGSTVQITGSLQVTESITGSLFGTASYAANGGVTQIVAGTNITISPTNGLGIVTINSSGGGGGGSTFPYTGSAIITGSLEVIGPVTITNSDATINGITIGRGSNNLGDDTALGEQALHDIATGDGNTAVGSRSLQKFDNGGGNTAVGAYTARNTTSGNNGVIIGYGAANKSTNINGNTIIGGSNFRNPDAVRDFDDTETLSISKGDSGNYGPGLPHIWAPKRILIPASNTVDILILNQTYYGGISAEWITDDGSSNMEMGLIEGVWDSLSTANILFTTKASINSPSNTFNYGYDGVGNMVINLTNNMSIDTWIHITARLIYRPYF